MKIIDAFAAECNAYATAIRNNIADKRLMPQCYGWFKFIPESLPNVPSYKILPWDSLLCYDEVVDALLLEYLPWEPLSCINVTDTIAHNIILSLQILHSAGIVHRDLEDDNNHILINKDNSVAFVRRVS